MDALRRTEAWVRDVVVGLELCPFARAALDAGTVRFTVSEATDLREALTDLWLALDHLLALPVAEVETTLVILPRALADLDAFRDALRLAGEIVEQQGYVGLVELVGFHPEFTRGAPDPADAVFRSPLPTVQILRARSLARASGPRLVGAWSRRNAELMRRLGERSE